MQYFFKALGCCNPALLLGPGVLLSPRTHRRASFFLSCAKTEGRQKKSGRQKKKRAPKNRPSFAIGQHAASSATQACLQPDEDMLAFLDDLHVLTTLPRARAACDIVAGSLRQPAASPPTTAKHGCVNPGLNPFTNPDDLNEIH